MGRGPVADPPVKEGYETGKTADAAVESELLLPHENLAAEEAHAWDGHLFECFGRCDKHGCSSCGLVYCLPCVAFGLNMRRGLVLSAMKQALIVAVLIGLTWSMRATHMASVLAECPPFSPFDIPSDHPPHHGHPMDFPRHLGPGFLQDSDSAFKHHFHSVDNLNDVIAPGAASLMSDKMMSDTRDSDVRRSEEPRLETQHHEEHSQSETKHAHQEQKQHKHVKAGHEKHKHKHSAHIMDGHNEHDHEHHAHKMKNSGNDEEHTEHHHHHQKHREEKSVAGGSAFLESDASTTELPEVSFLPADSVAIAADMPANIAMLSNLVSAQVMTVDAPHVVELREGVARMDSHLLGGDGGRLRVHDEDHSHSHHHHHQRGSRHCWTHWLRNPFRPHHHHHEHHHDTHREHHGLHQHHPARIDLEACGALAQTMSQLWLALVLYSIGLSIYAARRRSELRERFNIAGSKVGDFMAWIFCPTCALCQETRTLAANNVEAGIWRGRNPTNTVQYASMEAVAPSVHVMAMPEDAIKPPKV